jgi:hypothetical protein
MPDTTRALFTLADPDYIDLFTVSATSAPEESAERWARAVMEEAPLARRHARRLWGLIGLRLGPSGSPDHIQGWMISGRGDDWIRVATSSWYLSAEAVCAVRAGEVSLSLSLRYDQRLVASTVWAVVQPWHQRAVPVMLRQAVRLMSR